MHANINRNYTKIVICYFISKVNTQNSKMMGGFFLRFGISIRIKL